VVVVGKKSNFSRSYKTFEEFVKNFNGSEAYRQRIIRLHSKYPNASLSQLSGHPQKGKRSLSKLKERAIYKRSWSELTKRELILREKTLNVLSKVRRGQSLTSASKELHIKTETAIKHTNAFRKSKGKWIAKSQDRISRIMSIYENGKEEWIEVRDSRTASKIGKYNSAVKEFLISGNEAVLEPFKKPFKDANGKLHHFETDPNKLYEISESREEAEFYEIYKI
jgi:hypothetical protein